MKSWTNPYDLILLDLNLPDLNGIKLCQKIRQAEIQTPILILTGIFMELPNFKETFIEIMDQIDQSNAWEIEYCRVKDTLKIPNFGNYNKLFERSMGHALGPLAILFQLGFTSRSKEVKSLLNFFKHYLIARQLNDDAHDWEEDLKKGIINSVAAMLLSKQDLKNGINYPDLEQKFWRGEIDEVCKRVLKHVNLARLALAQISVVSNPEAFKRILDHLEIAAREALSEREKAITFIESYQSEK